MVRNPSRARGQAMVELIIVASLVLVPLFLAIPLLGKYLDIRSTAVQTARYAAWERTVWYGGDAASSLGWFGASNQWQANAKTDDQIRRELGVRQLSETTDAFSNSDRSASDFQNATKTLWQDRSGSKLLAKYSDIQNTVSSSQAPGTMNLILDPIANFASTLGPFTLEMDGEYTAKVTIKVKDFDTDHFLTKTSTKDFSEFNVLLANGWSANGPDGDDKTSTKQQVKGLVPFSIFTATIAGVPVMDFIQTAVSVFLPEASKLELGKIEPNNVPPDRLK
ncbi:MAG: TadE family protein [Methylomonas sp.]